MLLSALLKEITDDFKKSGILSPLLDAQVLISHVLQIEKHELFIGHDRALDEKELKKINSLVKRRLDFEPVAYITGVKEFYSLPFFVNRDVLIPRPETELIVDLAIYYAKQNDRVLDLGTGSGAIAVSIKHNRPDLTVYASDISEKALKTAKKNSRAVLGGKSVKFFNGSLFEPFRGEKFGLIASNPPYLNRDTAGSLQKELLYEPDTALFSEESGKHLTNEIIEKAGDYLAEKGILILEIGYDMKDFVQASADKRGYRVSIMNDYSGFPRVAVLS